MSETNKSAQECNEARRMTQHTLHRTRGTHIENHSVLTIGTTQDLASHLLMFSIFSGGFPLSFGSMSIGIGPVLATISSLLLIASGRASVSRSLILLLFAILLHGIVFMALGYTSPFLFTKVYVSTAILYISFYLLCRSANGVRQTFNLYMKYSLAVSIIGIIQGISFLLSFEPGYDYSWLSSGLSIAPGGPIGIRLSSVLYEPSQVAFTMAPSIAFSGFRIAGLTNPKHSLGASICILLFAVLSASTTVLIVIALTTAAIILAKKRYILLTSLFVPIIILLLPQHFPRYLDSTFLAPTIAKFSGLFDLFTKGAMASTADATTFTLFENARLAFMNLSRSWGLGGGMGSHQLLYEKVIGVHELPHAVHNKNSAGNLLFRTISELGLIGILAIAWFFYSKFRLALLQPPEVWPQYFALLIGAVIFFTRNGTYAHYGLAFYVISLIFLTKSVPLKDRIS